MRTDNDASIADVTSRGSYSPVITSDDGVVEVILTSDHPGFSDVAYRQRRNAIAKLSLNYRPGDAIPQVQYTDTEHEVWRIVSTELSPTHEQHACQSFLDAKESLALPTDHIPQLSDVSDLLSPITGFAYYPVAGLAPLREFYGSFADRTFYSTQYIRHPSVPRYTPEPDIVHEVVGHANQLADPRLAEIYLAVGDAVKRTHTEAALSYLSKVFWFTMEFGVVFEGSDLKAYGAGILSSIGELEVFKSATVRPLDFNEMGTEVYDITHYQPVIYSLGSMSEVYDRLLEFYSNFDDRSLPAQSLT